MSIHLFSELVTSKLSNSLFLDSYYGKKHWRSKLDITVLPLLFHPRDLEAYISTRSIDQSSKWLRLLFHGHAISLDSAKEEDGLINYQKLMRMYDGGATIVLNSIQKAFNRIAYFNQALEHLFECIVHTNLYMTPSGMKGFNPHSDVHDVIILQLRGSKKWSIFQHTKTNKLDIGHSRYAKDELSLSEEITLQEGDVFYLPRGLVHMAESTHEASWHLTIGLTGCYWKDILVQAIQGHELISNFLNRPVPIKSYDKKKLTTELTEIINIAQEELSFTKYIDQFKEEKGVRDKKDFKKTVTVEAAEMNSLDMDMLFKTVNEVVKNIEIQEQTIVFKDKDDNLLVSLPIKFEETIKMMQSKETFSIQDFIEMKPNQDWNLFFHMLWNSSIIQPV